MIGFNETAKDLIVKGYLFIMNVSNADFLL